MNATDLAAAMRLVTDTFGISAAAIERESMDQEWAPVEHWYLASDRPGVPASVVVKTRRHHEFGWGGDPRNLLAERRALSCLDGSGFSPRLFASDDDAGVIVMEDIRDAQTVERVLFAADPVAARSALRRLASALGQMHAATTGIAPEPWNPTAPLYTDMTGHWGMILGCLRDLDFPDVTNADADIAYLNGAINDHAWWGLTHYDAIPCNVLVGPARATLIDFEGANPRHIAIDGAGLALSFPHYRYWADIPHLVVDEMTAAWRASIAPASPAVADDAVFNGILATGAVATVVGRLTRLPVIADPNQEADLSLRRRNQIVHGIEATIAICHHADAYPNLAHALQTIERDMRNRWPDANTPPRQFPAFNGGSRDGWRLYHDI